MQELNETGAKVNGGGYAAAKARGRAVMGNRGASPYLGKPELVEIKAVPAPDKSGSGVNEFNMNIAIRRAQAEEAKTGHATGAPAKPAGDGGGGGAVRVGVPSAAVGEHVDSGLGGRSLGWGSGYLRARFGPSGWAGGSRLGGLASRDGSRNASARGQVVPPT